MTERVVLKRGFLSGGFSCMRFFCLRKGRGMQCLSSTLVFCSSLVGLLVDRLFWGCVWVLIMSLTIITTEYARIDS